MILHNIECSNYQQQLGWGLLFLLFISNNQANSLSLTTKLMRFWTETWTISTKDWIPAQSFLSQLYNWLFDCVLIAQISSLNIWPKDWDRIFGNGIKIKTRRNNPYQLSIIFRIDSFWSNTLTSKLSFGVVYLQVAT